MSNICEYKNYVFFNNVFIINDIELKEYLSNTIKKQYIKELGFIQKDDIINNYVEIFKDTYTLNHKLQKLKEIFDKNQTIINKDIEQIYNFEGRCGC